MPLTSLNTRTMTEKYSLKDIPGTNGEVSSDSASLLISGEPMSGKQELVYELLGTGINSGESTIIISPTDPAKTVYQELEPHINNPETLNSNNFNIIDCTGNSRTTTDIPGNVQYTESAGDLTGIGIELSKRIERAQQESGNVRVALLSLSPLIMYSDVETVYRFLHVLTSRIQAVDAFGIFVLDSAAHDTQTLNLLTSLFDAEVKMNKDTAKITFSGL